MVLKFYAAIFLIYLTGLSSVSEAVQEVTQDTDFKGSMEMELSLPLHPLREKESEKTLNFFQDNSWKIKWEQVKSFDFLKKAGGSDLFYYYIQILFNFFPNFIDQIESPSSKQSWEDFCYESNCLKGLDPKKMKGSAVQSMIRKLSADMPSLNLFPSGNISQDIEAVVFVQRYLAPKGYDLWSFINNEKDSKEDSEEGKEIPDHWEEIQQQINSMKQQNMKQAEGKENSCEFSSSASYGSCAVFEIR